MKKRDLKAEDKFGVKSESGLKKSSSGPASYQDTQCKLCKESFINAIMLKKHMAKHEVSNVPKEFPCTWPDCKLICHDAGKLRKHYIGHTGGKPYKCDVCSRGFDLEYNMKIHRRIHSGDRAFKCSVCSKSFSQKTFLNLHMNIHSIPGKKAGSVCRNMVRQGIVPAGSGAFYKRKLQRYYKERKTSKPSECGLRGKVRF